jgi:hypothetical protein
MCQLVGEVLRRGHVLDECVRDSLGVRSGGVQSYDCGCEGGEALLAFGGQTGGELGEQSGVVGVLHNLPL